MKIVLDTNVLASGIFFSGPPSEILDAWRHGALRLVVTPPILEEYSDVARRIAERFPTVDISQLIDLVIVESEMCAPASLANQVCSDATDDKFLAAAVSGGAEAIVSGDRHLLDVSGFQGISVLTPRVFVETVLKK